MYVFLKCGHTVKTVPNVTIDEDSNPVVDGRTVHPSPRDGVTEGPSHNAFDGTTWFKSLLIEAVYIDCGARHVRWCIKPVTIQDAQEDVIMLPESPVRLRRKSGPETRMAAVGQQSAGDHVFIPPSARRLFMEEEGMMEFNPNIDEMFERTERLFVAWDLDIEKGKINQEIARILHCYIFPAVTFQHEDIPILQKVGRLVGVKQRAVEAAIVEKEREVSITDRYLDKQKELLLTTDAMATQAHLAASNTEFVSIFYLHMMKDIQARNMRLDILQTRINGIKKARRAQEVKAAGDAVGGSEQEAGQNKKRGDPESEGEEERSLTLMQGERDALHESLQKLLAIREAIKSHLYRPFIPKKKQRKGAKVKLTERETLLQKGFCHVHEELTRDKEELKRLCYRKLHLVSVREAFAATVTSLRRGHRGAQGDFSEFSVYGGGDDERQPWRSMQTKVDDWVKAEGSLRSWHHEGVHLVCDLADGMLSDLGIASMGLEGSEVEMQEILNRVDGEYIGDTALNDDKGFYSIKRGPMVQVISEQVQVHLWDMAERIINRMNVVPSPGSRLLNRAWMCYDPHFWKEAGGAVERVYAHYHADIARRLHSKVVTIPLTELLDVKFFNLFFCGGKASCEQSGETVEGAKDTTSDDVSPSQQPSALTRLQPDGVSLISLDLQRCSVSDLYARANRDGARLEGQMLEMDSLRPSVTSLGSHSSSDPIDPASSAEEVSSGATVDSSSNEKDGQERDDDGDSSASESGHSVHSEDLFDSDGVERRSPVSGRSSVRGSQTVASVASRCDLLMEPHRGNVEAVITAGSLMDKLRALSHTISALSKQTGEVCGGRGMDYLQPMCILATGCLPRPLFVRLYLQVLMLADFQPGFVLHSIGDFGVQVSLSTYTHYLTLMRKKKPVHDKLSSP